MQTLESNLCTRSHHFVQTSHTVHPGRPTGPGAPCHLGAIMMRTFIINVINEKTITKAPLNYENTPLFNHRSLGDASQTNCSCAVLKLR